MKVFMATVVMVAFSVLANLLLKLDTLSSATAAKIFGFWGWRTLAGCASFGVALASYSLLLRLLPLNIAQSFAALQFVGIILASWLVLGEEITLLRAAGMATIIVGIIIVAASDA